MRHIDFALECIQCALRNVAKDRHTPAVIAPEVSDYLIDLAVKHPDDGSEFSQFVISLPYDAIHHELLNQLIPEDLRHTVLARRAEHKELQIKKENEIAAGRFDNAADYRDRQEGVWKSIQEAVAGQELVVTPQMIDSVLKLLGYNEP